MLIVYALLGAVAGILSLITIGAVTERRTRERQIIEIYPESDDRSITIPKDGRIYRITLQPIKTR